MHMQDPRPETLDAEQIAGLISRVNRHKHSSLLLMGGTRQ
jgi:hypothetical protein